jgi:hypothetical protein
MKQPGYGLELKSIVTCCSCRPPVYDVTYCSPVHNRPSYSTAPWRRERVQWSQILPGMPIQAFFSSSACSESFRYYVISRYAGKNCTDCCTIYSIAIAYRRRCLVFLEGAGWNTSPPISYPVHLPPFPLPPLSLKPARGSGEHSQLPSVSRWSPAAAAKCILCKNLRPY